MKNRYKTILIVFCVLAVAYVPIITVALGPEDVLNPASVLYFPGIVIQLAANEGNGIICVDACGPCSAWGSHHLLVDGECKIPDKVDDCYSISPPMEWKFENNNCIPLAGVYNYNNTTPHDPEEFANHSSPNMDYLIVLETGETFSGQYIIINGTVQRISFVENPRVLTIHLEHTEKGKIELIAHYWMFYPNNIEAEQGYDVYADGKKIEHLQRTLSLFEIPFVEGTKEVTIASKILE